MHIPELFSFYNKTRIISGKKAIENIPFELGNMNACKPIVITDKTSVKNGLIQTLLKAFADSKITIGAVYDDVTYP
ncbi:MAG TPA: iron-containing alcohol dehydrogenase, partial [Spirochaetota bacterium]|nr:iron-containing alcohol dehydrogenase [Spirochaetota bacterium]HRU66828.1 iron-containing alcohol dehydrogenase [Spirochaetota bacterium]